MMFSIMVYMYITAAGMASSALSKRSSIPPCPGKIFPESFMPTFRFSSDSTRSPHVPKTTTTTANPAHSRWLSVSDSVSAKGTKDAMICDATTAVTAPPTLPSHDFFGDMRGKSLCLPSNEPKTYAPVSLDHRKMNTAKAYQ